jgi:diguanylate cyclase (GGDEF)-like protein
MDKEMLKQGKARRNDEVVTYPDGTVVHLETLKTPYFDNTGKVLGLIGISRDMTERKRKEEEILYLTYHDYLTGLYNRTYFEEAIRLLDDPAQLPLSVIIGDINGLKLINDALGHDEGDKLLTEVGKILMSCIRHCDVVARIGGDEFGILLPKTDGQTAKSIIKQIQNTCEQYANRENKETYYISISLGYGTKTNPNESLERRGMQQKNLCTKESSLNLKARIVQF